MVLQKASSDISLFPDRKSHQPHVSTTGSAQGSALCAARGTTGSGCSWSSAASPPVVQMGFLRLPRGGSGGGRSVVYVYGTGQTKGWGRGNQRDLV